LGESQSQRSRLPQTCFHPHHAAKAMQSLIKSSDGLLVNGETSIDHPLTSRTGIRHTASSDTVRNVLDLEKLSANGATRTLRSLRLFHRLIGCDHNLADCCNGLRSRRG
jgi:hypothetical protein